MRSNQLRLCSVGAALLFLFFFLSSSCGPLQYPPNSGTSPDFTEGAQQIGDIMASLDESGGSTGSYAALEAESANRTFARLAPASRAEEIFAELTSPLGLSAYAAACATTPTFSACTVSGANGVITRTFAGCTIGQATFTGTVTLTYSKNTCTMPAVGDSVTRVPSFTATGLRGATLAVSKAGTVGQKVLRRTVAPDTFDFTNDGIRRRFTVGTTATFDFTTQTTAAIAVTSQSRAGRVLSGGGLQVLNNLTTVTCTYVPTAVTWAATCNCASSGSWAATCSDGKTASLILTGCGTGTFTLGSSTSPVTFDRCYGI